MSEEIVSGSQTEATPAPERDPETEALYASFDIKPAAEKKEIVFPDLSKGEIPAQPSEDGQPPAIEGQPPEPKKLTVKFNKEDIEVDVSDDKIPEYVQKALALDKERERKVELEKSLDRAAKLAGYKDHAEHAANFDKLEKEQQQKQENEFEQLRAQIIAEYEDAGGDPRNLEAWLDKNPLLNRAKEVLTQDEQRRVQDEQQQFKQQWDANWNALYAAYPDLGASSQVFGEGGRPEWYTPDMESMVNRGLTPKEAYTLLNMDKIQSQSAKKTEQKIIKQQHLGARSLVEGQSAAEPDEVTLLPAQMELAAEFGVKLDGVRNQQKQLNSRR